MKKILSITLLFFVTLSFSQRWSAYGVKVSPENEEMVVKLMDDYFSANKIEGVTVTLYSVLFTPGDLNFTHEIIFDGETENMAKFYTPEFQGNTIWQLFASKINNFMEPVFSGNGWRDLNFGPENLPFQVVSIIDISSRDNQNKWLEMQNTMRTKYPRDDYNWMTGGIIVGGPHSDGDTWIVAGYPSYEAYMNAWSNSQKFRADNPKMVKEAEKMNEQIDYSTRTNVTRFMRLMVKQW